MTPSKPTPIGDGAPIPRVAALTAVVGLVAIVGLVVVSLAIAGKLDARSTPLVVSILGIVVSAVPALIGAAFAERASRDIRNGTVVAKAYEGAAQAIEDKQVMTRTGPVVSAELAALQELVTQGRRRASGDTDAGVDLSGEEPPA